MPYTLLKITSLGLAWISPILILISASRWMQRGSLTISTQRFIKVILIPTTWVIGLLASFAAQAFHETAWLANNPKGAVSEEDMIAIGDYPNIFAGWLLLGWLPVAVGLFLSRKRSRAE